MKRYQLKFITPCFCAGANQLSAEVRPSSIRGELRWWFRCLGGTKADEDEIFGSVAGQGNASSVLLRVSNVMRGQPPYSADFISPNEPGAYLHYLLTAPNDNGHSRMWETPPNSETKTKGVIRDASQLPPGTNFELRILQKRQLSDELNAKLSLSIEMMLRFGGIGYRRTRGFGAWMNENDLLSRSALEEQLNKISEFGFTWKLAQGGSRDALVVLRQVEDRLKGNKNANTGYRLNYPAKKRTALGYSLGKNDRQASAVLFRPCPFQTKSGDIQFALLELQAPNSVLGADTPKKRIIS